MALLVFWLSLLSIFKDISDSIRLSVDCEFLFVPWTVDRMNSLIFRLTVWELIRKLCASVWLESGTEDEIDGIFWAFSTNSIRGSSFLLNLLTLLLILFLKAFATRSPTAREYDGGGEYLGGASLLTSNVFVFVRGSVITTGWDRFKFCWHNRLMGKWLSDESWSSIGGRNKSSIRWRKKNLDLFGYWNLIHKLTSKISRGPFER